MKPLRAGCLALAALLWASCSVSEPRHGATAGTGAETAGGQLGSAAGGPADTASAGDAADAMDVSESTADAADGGSLEQARPRASSGGASSGPATAGASATSGPGVTPTSVTISLSAPFSGIYGPLVTQVVEGGVEPWLKEVNAKGGINGRQVILKKIDNKATSDGAVGACKEAQSNGTLMTLIVASIDSGNIEPECLDKASIPAILAIASVRYSSKAASVRIVNSYPDSGPTLATFVMNYLKDGGKKLGLIHVDAQKQAADGFVAFAKELGMNVAVVKRIERSQAAFTNELLELREAGVENVTLMVGVEVFGILRDAKALGYAPHWVGMAWPTDEYAQAAPDLLRGAFGVSNEATSDTRAYAEFSALAKKHGYPTASRSSMNVYGHALVLGEVLKAAGPTLTRASVVAAFEKIAGYDSRVIGSVNWSNGALVGAPAMFPVVCCTADNKWKGLGPARARF